MATRLRLTDEHDTDWAASVDGTSVSLGSDTLEVRDDGDGRFTVTSAAGARSATAAASGDVVWVAIDGHVLAFRRHDDGAPARAATREQDALAPPMSGTVVKVAVKPGDHVNQGDTLVVLEAMKMELPIRAPRAGTVRAVHCHEGELVQAGVVLVDLGTG